MGDSLRELLNTIQYAEYLQKNAKDDKEFSNKKENIVEFINSLKDYEQRFENPTLEKFLDRITLLSQDNGDDSELNRVKLMSFHA